MIGEVKNKKKYEVIEKTEVKEIEKIIGKKNFDYIVFEKDSEYMKCRDELTKKMEGSQITTLNFLENNSLKNFYSYRNQYLLYEIISRKNINSLLDYDLYFANGQMYLKPFSLSQTTIDGIGAKTNYPMIDEFYEKIFDSVKKCELNHYEAILLTAERKIEELKEIISSTEHMTNEYIIFNRETDETVKKLLHEKKFTNAQAVKCINGTYYLLNNRRQENISVYVVTHKKFEMNLPQGYQIIHAGRELNNDLGYNGDNSGENISKLNPYLNELTAMYWIWKNTKNDYVGTAHYRRYFSDRNSYQFSAESILKVQQAYEYLKKYDVLIGREGVSSNTQRTLIMAEDSDGNEEIAIKAITIIKKMIEKYQSKYLDAFDKIMNSQGFFYCNMLITRKYVYDELCQWLFSFILPATEEFLKEVNVDELTTKQKRILGFCAERMMSVWLLKQNLRLFDFPIMVNN